MLEDLQIDGGNHSNIPDVHPELCQFATPIYDSDQITTDGSGYSLNDSGPSTPIHGAGTGQPIDPPSPLILQPYAVEEPDDEPGPVDSGPELPSLPDYFERWQRELKDSVHNLESEPEHEQNRTTGAPRLFCTSRRGEKRKVAQPVGAAHCPTLSSKAKRRLNEHPISVPGLSPKRKRRRSKLAGDAEKPNTTSLFDFRETQANDSSSSEQPTTDASVDTMNENYAADEMDID